MTTKNWARSTIATAPSPATSGTSLVVASGEGARFPSVPFRATIWPAGATPTPANAEVVNVTARSTDTLTIARAAESSTARTVVVGDQIAATLTAGMFDAHARFFPVELFGAIGDGSTDDAAAIQAAITAADAAGGGVVTFADAVYAIATGLTVLDKPGVRLLGVGAAHDMYGSTPTRGTVLKWTGAAGGGPVLTVGATATSSDAAPGNAVAGMTIEAYGGTNSAVSALKVQSSWWGVYRDLHLRNGTTVTLDVTTVDLTGVEDTQGCLFEQISIRTQQTTSAKSIKWSSFATGGGNVSLNNWHRISIFHHSGAAWECGDSDSNSVVGLLINRAGGGTGIGVDLLGSGTLSSGHCRDNQWVYIQPGPGGVTSRGTALTQPAAANRMDAYSFGNSSAGVTLETGSTLYWTTTTGLMLLNNQSFLSLNAAGTGSVSLFRANTIDEFEVNVSSRFNGHMTLGNTFNLSLSTSTGSKIGTGTTQKLAFWNATPIVQPANTSDLRQLLIDLGLLATGGATPLNLNGGILTALQAVLSGGTVTASAPLVVGTQTWNSGSVQFKGQTLNVTDTTSRADSQLADYQVGGVSKYSVDKSGMVSVGAIDEAAPFLRYWLYVTSAAATVTVGASGIAAPTPTTTTALANEKNARGEWLLMGSTTNNSISSIVTVFTLTQVDATPIFEATVEFKSAITNRRTFIGLVSAAVPAAETLATISALAFRYSTGSSDTAWQAISSNASSQTVNTLVNTVTVAADTRYKLRIDARDKTAIKFYVNSVLIGVATATLPAVTTSLGVAAHQTSLTNTTAKDWHFMEAKIWQ